MIDKLLSQADLEKELMPPRKRTENNELCLTEKHFAQYSSPVSRPQENDPLYRHIFEHMNEGFAIIEMIINEQGLPVDYVFKEVNPAYEQLTGFTREQLIGKCRSDCFSPVDVEYLKNYYRVISSGQFRRFEEFNPTRDRCFDIRAYPLPGANQLAFITSDITDLKRAEAASRIKQQREELISHIARRLLTSEYPQLVIYEVCQQTIQFLNCDVFINCLFEQSEGCLRLNAWSGVSKEEACAIEETENCASLCLSMARQGSSSISVNTVESLEPGLDLVRALGIQAYISHPLIMGGRVIGTLSFGTRFRTSFTNEEIGLMKTVAAHIAIALERLLANQQLRNSEEKYRALAEKLRKEDLVQSENRFYTAFHSSPAMMSIQSQDRSIVDVNDTWASILGYSGGIVFEPSSNIFDLLLEPDQRHDICEQLAVQGNLRNYELIAKSKAGDVLTLLTSAEWIYLKGQPCILWHHIDITERKKAEEAMRLSEEKFSKSFHGLPIMMVIASLNEGRFLDINDAFCKVTGYERQDMIGRISTGLNIINEEKRLGLAAKAQEFGKLENVEIELYSKSGETLSCIFWSQLIVINGETCHITGIIDVTDKKRIESAISRLERLNLIGEMAASIGHEIRNPMTAIRGFLQLLGGKKEYSNDRSYFELMIEELDRANAIISEYLSMAKDKRVDLQPESLDSIITSLYPMIQSDANRYDMNVLLELGQLPSIQLDTSEVRQLILNMARNGLEAMSSGGTLTIGTTLHNEEAVLYIKDEGQGLAPELKDRLGTPFVTTKENGTGLGLAVCYSIATRHKARIEFDTGPHGTTFYTKFPMS